MLVYCHLARGIAQAYLLYFYTISDEVWHNLPSPKVLLWHPHMAPQNAMMHAPSATGCLFNSFLGKHCFFVWSVAKLFSPPL